MSHTQQRHFCESIRSRHKDLFIKQRVLDVGSYDVNGNNRYLFTDSSYLGIDIHPGKNVDIVGTIDCVADRTFTAVVSTEMLEHDATWEKSLVGMIQRLEPRGMLLLTCAGAGRAEHGTRRCPIRGMVCESDYYRNLMPSELLGVCEIQAAWKHLEAVYSTANFDTYLFGIKA